jgi:hypothetical protein
LNTQSTLLNLTNPGLLPYASNVGAPAIKVEDISTWKAVNAIKVNHQLQTHT